MDSPKPKKNAKSASTRVSKGSAANTRPKTKAKKDPNAPKRSLTAFLFFSNDKRGEIRAANPNLRMPDVARECARLWKEVDDNTKAKYQLMADEDKKRYEQQIKDYKNNN